MYIMLMAAYEIDQILEILIIECMLKNYS